MATSSPRVAKGFAERILCARGVTRSFTRGLAPKRGGPFAIHDVDLDIWTGDVIGIIGREGAGKTTLLQCLAGLLRRDAGTVEWFGETFPGGGCLPGLAYVPAMPVYYPFLSVRDVLEYRNARETTGRSQRALIDSALDRLGLADKSAWKIMELSREEVQRVAIAEALSFGSRVVLVDTSVVNVASACPQIALQALREHGAGGAAVVIAARDAHSVVSAVSRVVVLDEGRIMRSLYAASPANDVVSSFSTHSTGSARFVAERMH
jgi:ABC-type multidrug transport system ATPase subunit